MFFSMDRYSRSSSKPISLSFRVRLHHHRRAAHHGNTAPAINLRRVENGGHDAHTPLPIAVPGFIDGEHRVDVIPLGPLLNLPAVETLSGRLATPEEDFLELSGVIEELVN